MQIANVNHKRSKHVYEKSYQDLAKACIRFSNIRKPKIVENPTDILINTGEHHIREQTFIEIET